MDLILRLPNIYNIYNIYWSYKTTFDKSIVEVSNSRFVNNDKAKKPNLPSKKKNYKKGRVTQLLQKLNPRLPFVALQSDWMVPNKRKSEV